MVVSTLTRQQEKSFSSFRSPLDIPHLIHSQIKTRDFCERTYKDSGERGACVDGHQKMVSKLLQLGGFSLIDARGRVKKRK